MTDQQASRTGAGPVGRAEPPVTFPPGRYGRRREPRRRRPWLVALLAALTLAGMVGIGYRLYTLYGNPEYTPRVLAETERADRHVTLRFEVVSRAGAGPALCRVRARGIDGAIVGTADVPVPAGRRVVQTYTLATTARTVLTDIPKCRPASAK